MGEEPYFMGLGDLPGGAVESYPHQLSWDGSTVVGWSKSDGAGPDSNVREAFRWTRSSRIIGLGDLSEGGFMSLALGVSSDGSAVVGY